MLALRKFAVSLTNDWWKRPLLFLLLFYLIRQSSFFLLSLTCIPAPVIIALIILLSAIIPSLLIESLRPNSKSYYIGFFYDIFIRRNLFLITIILFLTFLFLCILLLISEAMPKINSSFDTIAVIVLTIQIFIIAFYEEIIFRGIIFQSLIEKFGEILPTFLLSLVFTLFHLHNPAINLLALINLFLASILFSIIFLQTRSLLIVILYHFLWNFFQVLILHWNVSGIHYSLSIFIFPDNALPYFLNGGQFGLEATPVLTIILLIHVYFFTKYLKKSPFVSSLLLKREYLKPE